MKHIAYVLYSYLQKHKYTLHMIRPYNETDLEKIMKIWREAEPIAHPFLKKDFVKHVDKLLREQFLPNSKTWVYEDKNQVLAFIGMMGNEIGGLFVKPNNQSKGIGTLLMNHVSQYHDTLEVEVFNRNIIGKPFYVKHGFKINKEYIHNETKEKVLRMYR